MTRVVVDTNVLVSSLINEHGAPATVLALIESGRLLWCVSAPIISEYREVISRPKFSYVQASRVQGVLLSLEQMTLFTEYFRGRPGQSILRVC